eukprot:TRINITY_DN51099_c0_g1_i2.p1 TRINITY_DN51099_c0_g1~~TRINITY_DN51099_c0_g1_i2.p1  ORF type:complete len:521 (+),score=117.60 TRINITY_DN51099_c0_g1_i2:50-1612(+)
MAATVLTRLTSAALSDAGRAPGRALKRSESNASHHSVVQGVTRIIGNEDFLKEHALRCIRELDMAAQKQLFKNAARNYGKAALIGEAFAGCGFFGVAVDQVMEAAWIVAGEKGYLREGVDDGKRWKTEVEWMSETSKEKRAFIQKNHPPRIMMEKTSEAMSVLAKDVNSKAVDALRPVSLLAAGWPCNSISKNNSSRNDFASCIADGIGATGTGFAELSVLLRAGRGGILTLGENPSSIGDTPAGVPEEESNHRKVMQVLNEVGVAESFILDAEECAAPTDRKRTWYLCLDKAKCREMLMDCDANPYGRPELPVGDELESKLRSHLRNVISVVNDLRDKVVPYDLASYFKDEGSVDYVRPKRTKVDDDDGRAKWLEAHRVAFEAHGLAFDQHFRDVKYSGNAYYTMLTDRERSVLYFLDKIHPLPEASNEVIADLGLNLNRGVSQTTDKIMTITTSMKPWRRRAAAPVLGDECLAVQGVTSCDTSTLSESYKVKVAGEAFNYHVIVVITVAILAGMPWCF